MIAVQEKELPGLCVVCLCSICPSVIAVKGEFGDDFEGLLLRRLELL